MTGPWIALVVALTALVLVLGVVVLGLMRRVVPLLEAGEHRHRTTPALTGLAVGETVRPFQATRGDGVVIGSDRLLAKPRVFLFMSASCEPCRLLAADLRDRSEAAQGLRLVTVLQDEAESRALELPPGLEVLYQPDREVSEAFRNSGFPHAFAVDPGGVVVAAGGVRRVEDLKRLDDVLVKGGDAALHRISVP